MLCGSPEMVAATRMILAQRGFQEGARGEPGHFVVQKAFADR
jgi:ferredoxin--NADP+ reductase